MVTKVGTAFRQSHSFAVANPWLWFLQTSLSVNTRDAGRVGAAGAVAMP